MQDDLKSQDSIMLGLNAGVIVCESQQIHGHYDLTCIDQEGNTLWVDEFDNVVTYVGQNELLAAALQGSSYTVTGPYMLLISSTSFSAVSVNDTMTSHSGWLEAGSANAPTYSGNRPTVSFNAPATGTITSSGTIQFSITGSGTIQGIAITFGTSASNSIGNTGGTLLSAGTLTAAQPVINGNTVVATYTLSL